MSDGPFYFIAQEMEEQIALGATTFQKFSCLSCNARQTMPVPNVLYKTGKCQECGFITDIEATGCGFMLVASDDPGLVDIVRESIENAEPRNRN